MSATPVSSDFSRFTRELWMPAISLAPSEANPMKFSLGLSWSPRQCIMIWKHIFPIAPARSWVGIFSKASSLLCIFSYWATLVIILFNFVLWRWHFWRVYQSGKVLLNKSIKWSAVLKAMLCSTKNEFYFCILLVQVWPRSTSELQFHSVGGGA